MQTVKLNNVLEMPILGYGVYLVESKECERCVTDALEVGYRMIDTAQAYYNEEGVGSAWTKSGIKREDLFLVSKIWVTNAGEQNAYDSILKSLDKLQTDYLDLMLIHQCYNDYYGTWRAMERAYKAGKLKAIGLSNFMPDRYVDIASWVEIKPMVVQLETHVFFQQQEERKWLDKYGAQIMSWGPLAHGIDRIFNNETLVVLSKKYNKTAAQIALRFLTQENVIVIPKSTHKERMAENFNIFDFEITEDDMRKIRALDTGKSDIVDFRSAEMSEFFVNYTKEHGEV